MGKSGSNRIVFIGSGRLATVLAKAFRSEGFSIVQVYSRTLANAQELAAAVGAAATNSIAELVTDADYYLLAVADNAIAEVAAQLPPVEGVVVHTSGSTAMEALSGCAYSRYGVFYPLQTFSKERAISFQQVPLFIEGVSPDVLASIRQLALAVSCRVQELSSPMRMRLHIAAVFACNFANHMLAIGDELMTQAGLDFSLLHPLVSEAVTKALAVAHPAAVQTGPAAREDTLTIDRHVELLSSNIELQQLYKLLTKSIIRYKHK